jgi:VWFA-related protein
MCLIRLRRCFAVLAFCLPPLLSAQGHLPPVAYNPREGLIRLDMVVTDPAGKPVSSIVPRDLTLLDGGKPVKILTFQAHAPNSPSVEPPVTIILLVDTLNLPERLASYERREVRRFLQQNGGRLAQPVSLFELSNLGILKIGQPSTDGHVLAAEFTHNSNLEWLRRPANGMRGSSLESDAEPAILSALKALGDIAAAERQNPGRKLLLWVGPGWGLGSGAYGVDLAGKQETFDAIEWFYTLLREARITLYSFSVGETNADGRALLYRSYLNNATSVPLATFMHLYRKVIAVQTGGRVLEPSGDLTGDPVPSLTGFTSNADLVQEINGCIEEAATFYTLSFDPSQAERPDEYHELKVQVDKPGVTARTTTGYYDQPYYSNHGNHALRPVTVQQLKQVLVAIRDQPDAESARQLSEFVLTERLSSTGLTTSMAGQQGAKARQALVSLADASAFLDPPASEISADPPPDTHVQQRLASLALEYLNKTLPDLPNFYATRTVVNYLETPAFEKGDAKIMYQPLHIAETDKDTVFYRNGYEAGESNTGEKKKRKQNEPYLVTYGTFGPLLREALDAIFHDPGSLSWKRWERRADKPIAVFAYSVPEEESSDQIGFCCSPDGDGTGAFRLRVGYHGEIAIDPATGAILRLGLSFDLQSTTPLIQSQIMIEYGPVEIAGKSYICPIKSVSLSNARAVTVMALTLPGRGKLAWRQSFKTYGPYAAMLNDITFDTFHLFHADSHLITGFTPAPEGP